MASKKTVTKRQFLKVVALSILGPLLPGRASALDLLENLQEGPLSPIEKDLLKSPQKQRLIAQTQEN